MATSTSTPTATAEPPSTTNTATATPFPFPREYNFPPFFTRQTQLATRHAQLTKWSALVLAYARHHRIFRLALSSASESDLFCNRRIDRSLAPADVREVVELMRKEGRAEYVGGSGSGSSSGGGDVVFLYWRKPEEWAKLVEEYVAETGQKGSVLTVYELSDGEGTRGREIHGVDNDILLKALNILVKRGKAQIFGSDESPGVKFF